MNVIIVATILFFTSHYLCFSQADKLRLAQSYEQQGDFANSFRLYYQLLETDQLNLGYFLGVVRSLNNQQKYTELLPIVETQVKRTPSSLTYSIAGETLWKLGQPTKADENWNTAVKEFIFSEDDVLTIANSQLTQRQIEKAISTFIAGRKKFTSNELFAEELSQCYAATGKIDLAMTEIITLLRTSFNLGVVQGKITALISNPNTIPVVEESLLKLKKTDQENLLNYRLIEWFYRSTNQTTKALNIVSELDKKSGSNGGEIYQFASVCSQDGLFEDALKAYSMVIDDNSAAANLRISAIFGYTRTLETKLSISTSITKEQISDVLQRYESIAKDPTASAFAPEIVYRKGMVLKIFAKDIPAAKKEFTQCASVYSSTQFASLSRLELAEIAIVEGSFEDAKNILKPMRALSETNELRRKADFFIAEMLWFEGHIDSAKVLYGAIAKKVQTNEANDALERIILIEQFQDQKVRLQEYAKATYLTFQMKYNDALNAFRSIISSNATDDISELSYLDILLIQHSTNQDGNVLTTYTEFIKTFPESIWGDKALFLFASSLKKLQRFEESKKAFQQLLATFPSSTYLTATREELRKIPL